MRILICSLFSTLTLANSLFAGDFHRAGMFDVGGSVQGFLGETVDGHFNGVAGDIKLDEVFAGGINFSYHITDYLAVNTDLLITEADVRFSNNAVALHDDAPTAIWSVNLDYYILPTPLTPFITAGIGLLSMDNEHRDDDHFCWCSDDREIPISEVDFLWNVGAGLRWDPTEHLYIKLAYRLTGTELEYADEHMFLHSVMLTVGYSFQP
jgi:opacity protein-like surface antigen